MIYYIVDISTVTEGISIPVLVSEKDLSSFVSNYDTDNYKIINVYGVGILMLDYKEFLKKEKDLEHGTNDKEDSK